MKNSQSATAKVLPVQQFNLLCNNSVYQWYRFWKNYGYVAFCGRGESKISKAVWSKTKKGAILKFNS